MKELAKITFNDDDYIEMINLIVKIRCGKKRDENEMEKSL